MNEPKRVPIKFWGQDKPAPEIAWDRIENALAGAYTYWLSTVSAVGVPQPRPVWGMRFDGRMLLTVGSTTVWRNVERDPHASVHLESASEVVILEGTVARVEDDDLLARFLTPYNAKYRVEPHARPARGDARAPTARRPVVDRDPAR